MIKKVIIILLFLIVLLPSHAIGNDTDSALVCNIIGNLSVDEESNENYILALAQKRFSESDNVAVAWRALCEDSIELIDELFETLSNNNFELSYFDKFIELESLLLLELHSHSTHVGGVCTLVPMATTLLGL